MAGAETNGSMRTGEAIPRLSHMTLVGKRTAWPNVSKLSTRERRHPSTHVVPASRPRAVPGSIMPRRLKAIRRERHMGEATVAAKAAREAGEGTRIDVREVARTGSGDAGNAGNVNVVIEARENIGSGARREGAEEVAEAGGDAEADEEIALIRGVSTCAARARSGIGAAKDVVKTPDKKAGAITVGSNKGHNKVVMITKRYTEDRVARGDGSTIPTDNAAGALIKRQRRVSEGQDGRTEGGADGRSGGRAGLQT